MATHKSEGFTLFDQSGRLLEDGYYRHSNDFIKHIFTVVGKVERSGELEKSGIEDEQVLCELSLL